MFKVKRKTRKDSFIQREDELPPEAERIGDSIDMEESANPVKKNNDNSEKMQTGEDELPTFSNIGRWAKDCLLSGYVFGNWYFECKTQPNENYGLTSFWNGNLDMSTISGGIGVSQNFGILKISQYIRPDGNIATFGLHDETEESLWKAIFRGTYFNPEHGLFLDLNTAFHFPPVRVDLIIPILKEPKFKGYILLHSSNFLMGYRTVFDFPNMEFDTHNISLGYFNDETEVGLKLENWMLRGSIFQRLGENWAFALKGDIYNTGVSGRRLIFGGQYELNENSTIKAKIQINGMLEAAYQVEINDNVRTSISCGFPPTAPLSGDYKFGVSFSFVD